MIRVRVRVKVRVAVRVTLWFVAWPRPRCCGDIDRESSQSFHTCPVLSTDTHSATTLILADLSLN